MLAAILASGCISQTSNYPTSEPVIETGFVSAAFVVEKNNEVILYKTVRVQKGTNGLDAMKEAGINFESGYYVGMGSYIKSIMGAEGDNYYYWALYVDGKYADKAIDAYILNKNIEIKWVYEKVDYSMMG